MNDENKPNVYVSERHMNPELLAGARKRENFTWAGVLAIIATLCFIVLLVLQYLDFDKLNLA